MDTVIDTFYKKIIPGLLTGQIDCGINIRIIANVLFKDNNKLIKAKPPCDDLYIPTLVINDRHILESVIMEYVNIMMDFNFSTKKYIDKEDLPCYFVSCALANMEERDYLQPEKYFEKLIYIHKNNPIPEQNNPLGYSEELKGFLSLYIKNESPNQECPFIFKVMLDTDLGAYSFPVIRYYIIGDTAYIGSIQSKQSSNEEKLNKKVRRRLYKVNDGVNNEELLNVDPAAVTSLSMFSSFIEKYGINKIKLLPYCPQRSNDKKLQKKSLENLYGNAEAPYRAKVVEIFRKTDLYFDRLSTVRSQLENALLRISYHFPNTTVTKDNNYPNLYIDNLDDGNNELLNSLNNVINNKKTRL